jgi:rhodanese-related sulfurtransferase
MLNRFSKFFAILLAIVFVVSCSDDATTPTINEGDLLIKYLEANGDYVNTYLPALITASELHTLNQTGKAYIIDLRLAADFQTGYIKNAVNVPLADLLTHIKTIDMTKYDKVALVCYTGQTAGFATSLMRFMGYDKVFDLKFGMSSWHNDFATKWKSVVAVGNEYASQFVNTPSPAKPAKGNLPVLNTGKKTGKEILEARVQALLTEGFGAAGITAQTAFQELSKYYIANYWTEAQYLDPGHIPGAIQYTPKLSLKYAEDLTTLPTDKPIIIYCHTGTQSSMLAAFLRLFDYDAKSLLFGANSMIYDKMVEKNMSIWKDAEIAGLEYEKP